MNPGNSPATLVGQRAPAWCSSVYAEGTFPQPITHPAVADTNHSVSRAFGALEEDPGFVG